ncbi:MAG TPA: HAD hydrolase-like protein [Candidatus Nanoarchaeia archaeon]|nr:HAD hydrolase-like protein [Candidatus Nanoarchaeia archaeon]
MRRGLICFDLDNTLIKSNRCHLLAYQAAFKKNHVQKKISNRHILRYFGEGSRVIVEKLFPKAPKAFIDTLLRDHDFFVTTQTAKKIVVIPGAREVLNNFRHHWRLALVSNCNHTLILALLKAAKIPSTWFSVIVGQDQVKHPKPAPDELLKTEHLLHRKADYFIGDSIYDVRAGRRAHVPVVAIPSGVHTASMLRREKPYVVCKTLREILRVIQ